MLAMPSRRGVLARPLRLLAAAPLCAAIAAAQGDDTWVQMAQPERELRIDVTAPTAAGGCVAAGLLGDAQIDLGAWIAELDDQGQPLWARALHLGPLSGYHANAIVGVTQATSGAFFAVGPLKNLHGSSGLAQTPTGAWIVRLEPGGDVAWRKMVAAGAHHLAPRDVVATADGGFAVTGTLRRADGDGFAAWVLRAAPDGEPQWFRSFTSVRSNGNEFGSAGAIEQTEDGGFAVLGKADNHSVWLLRLAEDGELQWQTVHEIEGLEWGIPDDLVEASHGKLAAVLRAWHGGDSLDVAHLLTFSADGALQSVVTYADEQANQHVSQLRLAPTLGGRLLATGAVSHLGDRDLWLAVVTPDGDAPIQRAYGDPETDELGLAVRAHYTAFLPELTLAQRSGLLGDLAHVLRRVPSEQRAQPIEASLLLSSPLLRAYLLVSGWSATEPGNAQPFAVLALRTDAQGAVEEPCEWLRETSLVPRADFKIVPLQRDHDARDVVPQVSAVSTSSSDFDLATWRTCPTVTFEREVEVPRVDPQLCFELSGGRYPGAGAYPQECNTDPGCLTCVARLSRRTQPQANPPHRVRIYRALEGLTARSEAQQEEPADPARGVQELRDALAQAPAGRFFTQAVREQALEVLGGAPAPDRAGDALAALTRALNALELDLAAPRLESRQVGAGAVAAVDFGGVAWATLHDVAAPGAVALELQGDLPDVPAGYQLGWPAPLYRLEFSGRLRPEGWMEVTLYTGGTRFASPLEDVRVLARRKGRWSDVTAFADGERGTVTARLDGPAELALVTLVPRGGSARR